MQPWTTLLKALVWENKHFFVFGWISSLYSYYMFFSQFVYVMLQRKKITSPSKTREPNGASLYPHAWLTSPQKRFKHQVSEKHTISNESSLCPFSSSLIPLTNYALFSSLCCSGVRTECAAHIALILADVSLPERFFFFFLSESLLATSFKLIL